MGTFEYYIDTMMNGETGMAALAEAAISLAETRAFNVLNQATGGILIGLRIIEDSVPAQFLDYMVQRNLDPYAEFTAALVQSAISQAALNASPELLEVFAGFGITIAPGDTISLAQVAQLAVNVAEGDTEEAAEAYRATIDLQLDIIRGTAGVVATPEQIVDAATLLFDTEGGFNFDTIPVEEHQDIYALMTSPAVAQAIANAGGDVALAYEDWAINNFRNINRQTIDDINTAAPADNQLWEYVSIVFNEGTGQLELRAREGVNLSLTADGTRFPADPRAGTLGLGSNAGGTNILMTSAYQNVQRNIDRLNTSLGGIKHLYDANDLPFTNVEFNELTRAQLAIGVPVEVVNDPRGVAGLTPRPTVADINAELGDEKPPVVMGDTAPLPNANPVRTPNVFNPETRRFEPAGGTPTPAPLGTTIPGGAEGTPDGQPAPRLETPTPEPVAAPTTPVAADPNNPYATMGWDEIGALDANALSPDARAQLQARVTELIAAGVVADPKELVGVFTKRLDATDARNLSKAFADAAADNPLNTGYAAISNILLEPNMTFRNLRLDNFENTINTSASDFLLGRLADHHGDEHILNMQPELQTNLSRFFQEAPPEIAQGLGILSGYRSVERQRELWNDAVRRYGSPEAARRWVAPPGSSQHNHGNAADLTWNGQSLAQAPAWVVNWLHANAERYGLVFPLSNENWHIELIGARG
jgi:hypothetical protein